MIVGVGVGRLGMTVGIGMGGVRANYCRLMVRVIRRRKYWSLGVHEPSDGIDGDGAIVLGIE